MSKSRIQWSNESMLAAVEYVKQLGNPLREASRLYNVPLETLRRRTGFVEIDCRPVYIYVCMFVSLTQISLTPIATLYDNGFSGRVQNPFITHAVR